VSTDPGALVGRCARHPARPARQICGRCGRLRCDADAAAFGPSRCGVCERDARDRPVGSVELAVRAGLGGLWVALIGGWIATQYVEDHIFSLVVPALVGVAVAWAANLALGRHRGAARAASTAMAIIAALLGTGLGFRLVPGDAQSVFHPLDVVGAPYLCAVLGAAAWQLLTAVVPRETAGTAGRRARG
jgi:hypothetical protein